MDPTPESLHQLLTGETPAAAAGAPAPTVTTEVIADASIIAAVPSTTSTTTEADKPTESTTTTTTTTTTDAPPPDSLLLDSAIARVVPLSPGPPQAELVTLPTAETTAESIENTIKKHLGLGTQTDGLQTSVSVAAEPTATTTAAAPGASEGEEEEQQQEEELQQQESEEEEEHQQQRQQQPPAAATETAPAVSPQQQAESASILPVPSSAPAPAPAPAPVEVPAAGDSEAKPSVVALSPVAIPTLSPMRRSDGAMASIAKEQQQQQTPETRSARKSDTAVSQVRSPLPIPDLFPQTAAATATAAQAPMEPGLSASSPLPAASSAVEENLPGAVLERGRATYTVGQCEKKKIPVMPITLYSSKYALHNGSLIAASQGFICYAVKDVLVRVLSTSCADRVLLKGHGAEITDMRFSPFTIEKHDMLATVGADGSLFVWALTHRTQRDIASKTVLQVSNSTAAEHGFRFTRVAWSRVHANILATSGTDGRVYVWNIALLKDTLTGAAPQAPLDIGAGVPPALLGKAVFVLDVGAEASDLSFNTDGSVLAVAAGRSGVVSLWQWDRGTRICGWPAHDGGAVRSAIFCGIPFSGCDAIAQFSPLLITGNETNSEVKLWDTSRSPPTVLHTVALAEPRQQKQQPGFFNHVNLDTTSGFLFLLDTLHSSGYVLHIVPPTIGPAGPDFSGCAFDYISEWSFDKPALCFSLAVRVKVGHPKPIFRIYVLDQRAILQYTLQAAHCYDESAAIGPEKPQSMTPLAPPEAPAVPPAAAAAMRPEERPAATSQHETTPAPAEAPESDANTPPEKLQSDAEPSPPIEPASPPPSVVSPPFVEQPPPQRQEQEQLPAPEAPKEKPTPSQATAGKKHSRKLEIERPEKSPASSDHEDNGDDGTRHRTPQRQAKTATEGEELSSSIQLAPEMQMMPVPTIEEMTRGLMSLGLTVGDIKNLMPDRSTSDCFIAKLRDPKQAEYIASGSRGKVVVNGMRYATRVLTQSAAAAAAQSPQRTPPRPVPAPILLSPSALSAPLALAPSAAAAAAPSPARSQLLQPDQLSGPPPPPASITAEQPAHDDRPKEKGHAKRGSTAGEKVGGILQTQKSRSKKGHQHQQPQQPATPESQQRSAPGALFAEQAKTEAPKHDQQQQVREESPTPSPTSVSVDTSGLEERLMKELKRIESSLGTRMDRTFQQLYDRTKPDKDSQAKLAVSVVALQQQAEQNQRAVAQSLKDLQRDMHAMVPALTKAMEDKVAKLAVTAVEKAVESVAPRLEAAARDAVAGAVAKQLPATSMAVTEAVQKTAAASTQAAFRASLQEVVVPSFERATTTMFRNISQSFDRGLHEALQTYSESLKRFSEKQQAAAAKQGGGASSAEMKLAVQSLVDLTQSVSASIIEMQKRVIAEHEAKIPTAAPSSTSAEAPPAAPVAQKPQSSRSQQQQQQQPTPPHPSQQATAQQQQQQMPRQVAPVAAQPLPPPPPPPLDPYAQVAAALSASQLEGAFHIALNQANLDIVVWLCKQVDPVKVCASKQLGPYVLLALIQQLGFDLTTQTDVKIGWLKELLLIDSKEVFGVLHAKPILTKLQQNMTEIAPRLNDPVLVSTVKLLSHVITSILSKYP